jgi:uncharacterized protein
MNSERDIAPDVIRGFALLGILVVNIQYMALNASGVSGQWTKGFANEATAFLVSTFFAGKFYLLFSLMYGYSSFYIIKGDKSNRARWIKRCFFFIVVGFLHAIFLWQGDILFWYGVFGLVLALLFFRSDKVLKRWNIGIYVFANATLLIVSALLLITALLNDTKETPTPPEPLDSVMKTGTFFQIATERFHFWTSTSISIVILQAGMAISAFLLGLRLSRRKYFSDTSQWNHSGKATLKALAIGLPLEVIAGIVFVSNLGSSTGTELITTLAIVAYSLIAPLLSFVYVQVLLRYITSNPQRVSWMAPAGKMSLTTYLSQSLITSVIFAPWGFGLFQKLELWQATLLAVLIWVMQIKIARWWLTRYQQGPMERLLNAVTK